MSETNVFYLPDEVLITYILIKLPIKTLLRCKSVSKRFNSIISSNYFAKLLLIKSNNNNNNSHLLINHKTCFLSFDFESFEDGNNWDYCSPFNDEGDIIKGKSGLARIIDANFHVPNSGIFVIGSCDGLVCLKTKLDLMYVWNPTTLVCREIPLQNQSKRQDVVWGFGCTTSGGRRDYKIVRICQNSKNIKKTIEIFSLLENCWTVSEEMMEGFGERPKLYGSGVSINDAIYWLYMASHECDGAFHRHAGIREMRWWIIRLNLVDQKLERVPLPDPRINIGGCKSPPMVFAMGGRLCACWKINNNDNLDVGTLSEEGMMSLWIKLYQVGYNIGQRHVTRYPNVTYKSRFAVGDNRDRDTLKFIDPAQESREDVYKLSIPSSRNVVNYTESLVSPF